MKKKITVRLVMMLALPLGGAPADKIALDWANAPVLMLKPMSWPASLSVIVDPTAPIANRIKAVHFLGGDLSHQEIACLYIFLESFPDQRERNLPGLRVVKNDILNCLEDQSVAPSGLTRTMVEMYRDRRQDAVIRDYAIQHLATWYERCPRLKATAKGQIEGVLNEAMMEQNSIAGTALLSLHRLSQHDPSIRAERSDKTALLLASSSETDLSTRITALQVCAERGLAKALPVICDLVQSSSPTALKISAIGALGRLGGPEYLGVLQQLRLDSEPAVRTAALSAIRRSGKFIANREPLESPQ